MALSLKAGQITEEERQAAREKPFRNGGSYDYAENDGSDNGFQDAYNELVRRIRHTKQLYKDQLDGLKKREDELLADVKTNRKRTWILVVITVIFCLFWGFRNRIIKIAVFSDWGSALTITLEMIIPVLVTILVFFLIPLFVIQQIKLKKTWRLLSGRGISATAAKERGIITFQDERTFLMTRISNIDDYMDQMAFRQMEVETENLRQMDLTNVLRQQGIWEEKALEDLVNEKADADKPYTGILIKDTEQKFGEEKWSEEERDIIARMRSLSLFREYRANNISKMSGMGYGWMLITCTSVAGVMCFLYYCSHK